MRRPFVQSRICRVLGSRLPHLHVTALSGGARLGGNCNLAAAAKMAEHSLSHPDVTCLETPPESDAALRIRRVEYRVKTRNANQPEFLQAFSEVYDSLKQFLLKNPQYITAFEVIVEPERTVTFRVPWFDDKGTLVSMIHMRAYSGSGGIGPTFLAFRASPVRAASQLRLPSSVQLRHWTVQGRLAVPPQCVFVGSEVSRLRANFQEQPHGTPDGRREGRFRF